VTINVLGISYQSLSLHIFEKHDTIYEVAVREMSCQSSLRQSILHVNCVQRNMSEKSWEGVNNNSAKIFVILKLQVSEST